ncbi:hypothetical protein SAMN05421766_104327 [Zobellia uliginosa]|uniref:Uncharacterized protein n=1 Tax=Zobellia uliginosa TaxID=143224 RepID=A0ABY1KVS6_9FLAO|nr:hypothetical protein SAMN05421766_104327 [Zobellia uliginosa]
MRPYLIGAIFKIINFIVNYKLNEKVALLRCNIFRKFTLTSNLSKVKKCQIKLL